MEFPKIYSDKEEQERFLFSLFMQRHFKMTSNDTKDFTGNFTPATLLNFYKLYYPNTVLVDSTVAQQLMAGGYVNPKYGEVTVNLNVENWNIFSDKFQATILKHIARQGMKTELYRQLNDKSCLATASVPELGCAQSISDFVNAFVFRPDVFPQWPSIAKSMQKVGVLFTYELYQWYCLEKHYAPVAKNTFIASLVKISAKYKGVLYRGYFLKQSGIPVISQLAIPTGEDLETSKKLGVGCITIAGKQLTTDGIIFSELTEDGKLAYLQNRKECAYVQRKEAEEEIKTREEIQGYRIHNRGTTEVSQATIQSGEAGIEQTPNGAITGGSISEYAGASTTDIISNTIGSVESSFTDDDVDTFDADDTDGEYAADDVYDAYDGDITEDNTTQSAKHEVLSALRVAYNLCPADFTKDTMQEYLDLMETDLTVDDCWDDLMQEVQ